MWCEFGANLVQLSMRQHEKYQTICDYTLTISHDISVIHNVKSYETPMQKLQEISFTAFLSEIFFLENYFHIFVYV